MYNIRQKLVFQQVSVDLNKHIFECAFSYIYRNGI